MYHIKSKDKETAHTVPTQHLLPTFFDEWKKLIHKQEARSEEQAFRERGAGISYPNFFNFLLL